ncbi:hypothetical protein ABZU76_39470 [Amycolatopsis sp. NPDC005232]|uniref:hypothetical protein n=1 Tax=Amycolatopsis sp. NPDC005232 TaxID=3157027 RepID=UPI0033BA9858
MRTIADRRALAQDLAGAHVQRGEQVRGAVPDVGNLLGELRILADLERALFLRPEPVLAPQLRHVMMRVATLRHCYSLPEGDVLDGAGHRGGAGAR